MRIREDHGKRKASETQGTDAPEVEMEQPGTKVVKVSENQAASSVHARKPPIVNNAHDFYHLHYQIVLEPTSTESRHGAEDFCERLVQGPCWAKLLITSEAAHALMSQALAGLKKLCGKTGAVARLSPSGAYFPGTQSRVIIIGGSQTALKNMIKEVCNLMINSSDDRTITKSSWASIQCVVPKTTAANTVCKGDPDILGEVAIRSGCRVNFDDKQANLDDSCKERLIKIEGQCKQVVRATRRFFASIQSDPDLYQNIDVMNYPMSVQSGRSDFRGKGGSVVPLGASTKTYDRYSESQPRQSSTGGGTLGGPRAPAKSPMQIGIPDKVEQRVLSRQVCMQVPIPPGSAGRMIGKGGSTLRAISGRFGVRIHVSDKDQLFLNSEDRIMSISGVLTDVQRAHCMVEQILQDVEDQNAAAHESPKVDYQATSDYMNFFQQGGAFEMGAWPTPNQHYQY